MRDWRDRCTFETCGLRGSFFGYRPSYSVNLAFTVLFGIATLAFLAQGILGKKWLGFTIAMACGCALEAVGYVGRVLAYNDLWHENPFLIQIVCLTIAPAFLAAGIYFCLSRIVITVGQENSRLKPLSYPRIFIPCDVLSLVLQAAGGGYASMKTHVQEDPAIGNNIMIAGLSFQVLTLLIFIVLALDFAIRTVRNNRDPRKMAGGQANVRLTWKFKCFLIALSLSTLCIFTRCVYRVAELSEGWQGHLIKVQGYFVGLEGAVIIAAVYLLILFHPAFCFKDATWDAGNHKSGETKTWYGRRKRPVGEELLLDNRAV